MIPTIRITENGIFSGEDHFFVLEPDAVDYELWLFHIAAEFYLGNSRRRVEVSRPGGVQALARAQVAYRKYSSELRKMDQDSLSS